MGGDPGTRTFELGKAPNSILSYLILVTLFFNICDMYILNYFEKQTNYFYDVIEIIFKKVIN